eukprot:gene44994-57187_t
MPHAIFFDLHGHAIHGSFDPIGRPAASHGCVRLDPANAATLFDLVKKDGMANTRVEIGGDVQVALRTMKGSEKTRVASSTRRQQIASRARRGDVEAVAQPGVVVYSQQGCDDGGSRGGWGYQPAQPSYESRSSWGCVTRLERFPVISHRPPGRPEAGDCSWPSVPAT